MEETMKDLEGKKVCVTGASGFVASWLVKRLLLSGYRVIGTVRDPDDENRVGHLRRLEGARERLELVQADLLKEGSFDDAVFGCHGVFHLASPVLGTPKSDLMVEILQPAIDGTLNVLRSCKRNPSLRRVVLTSSSSTVRIRPDLEGAAPLDETSWSSEELCEKLQIWYALSKTLAEKAAWRFCEENGIDLVTVMPSFVIGPSLPAALSSTASDVAGLLKGVRERFEWHGRMGYVHIDDVALSQILVYENQSARGRYLCSSTVIDVDELLAILSSRYPSLPIPKTLLKHERPHYDFDVSKIKGLGMTFRSIEEMFDDCVESLTMQGHLSP
ncbi:tetraketide alpha-pyrone reductase 1 [Salvia hispanica]|uniref:tetraketide alpha-pyrone reductase 1 n=1 Tax=Salvia hispanica TaxID=49212 RepID=UPI0020092349|nr:tetraketide alpha-pyrone reductase 1 [Salvia hispanica]